MDAPDALLAMKPSQSATNARIAEVLKAKVEARQRYQEAVAAYYDAILDENLKP